MRMRRAILVIAMMVIVAADVDDGEQEFDYTAIGLSDIVGEDVGYHVA